MSLEVGKKVPDFSAPNEKGEVISKDSLLGKKYILFFYPRDNTPGCTREACSIRDQYRSIKAKGYNIFGVSPDSQKKHQNFISKFEFQYSLLSDPDKKMISDFGFWGKKKFMGKEFMGVLRTTVLVDEKGEVEAIIDKVRTKDHGDQILEIIDGF